jgi:hypothetical protein
VASESRLLANVSFSLSSQFQTLLIGCREAGDGVRGEKVAIPMHI